MPNTDEDQHDKLLLNRREALAGAALGMLMPGQIRAFLGDPPIANIPVPRPYSHSSIYLVDIDSQLRVTRTELWRSAADAQNTLYSIANPLRPW